MHELRSRLLGDAINFRFVYALRQVEAGKKMAEVCREMGVLPQEFTVGNGVTRGWG